MYDVYVHCTVYIAGIIILTFIGSVGLIWGSLAVFVRFKLLETTYVTT